MEQPEGFKIKGQENKVLRLCHALYRLKQAALAWWKELAASMKKLGFRRLNSDAGLFIFNSRDDFVIAVIYVDDAMFFGKNLPLVIKKKQEFMDKWECRDLGEAKEFLRMCINHKGDKILIDQTLYLEKVLLRFKMVNARIAPTPLPGRYIPSENTEDVNHELRSLFQQVIGSLLYIMLRTRPDITYAVTKLLQFAATPFGEHLNKALYICRYLAGTKNYALVFDGKSQKGVMAYTDSDWAADAIKRRSITGYFFKLANGIFCWQSRAQKTVVTTSVYCMITSLYSRSVLSEVINKRQSSSEFSSSSSVLSFDELQSATRKSRIV